MIESVAVGDELSTVMLETALFAWIEIVPSEMSVLSALRSTAPPEVAVSVVFAFRLEALTVIADPNSSCRNREAPGICFQQGRSLSIEGPG